MTVMNSSSWRLFEVIARFNITAYEMKIFFHSKMLATQKGKQSLSQQKTSRLVSILKQSNAISMDSDFEPLDWHEWEGIHAPTYIEKVSTGDPETYHAADLPCCQEQILAEQYSASSMLSAANQALESGVAFSPTSGFHHAHYSSPGTFCVLNALPLTAYFLIKKCGLKSVLILDCDYHRGNGTRDILNHLDESKISHQSLGFYFVRPHQANEYLIKLQRICDLILNGQYEAVIYQAGMDVLIGDPAGGGILTMQQAQIRDDLVFSACRQSRTPIVWNLAGGYQLPSSDGKHDPVIQGHINTVNCALGEHQVDFKPPVQQRSIAEEHLEP